MHIPDGMIIGAVCPATAVISTAGVAAAAWLASRAPRKPSATSFAAVTALIFAAQMMNFPIQYGTSGHLLGGVLAAVLLGTPFAVLSLGVVVLLQSLLFADGGLAVLGANVLNMALIGAGLGGWLANRLRHTLPGPGGLGGIAVAAWLSVVLAALACSIELALAGTAAFALVAPAMLVTHAVIGLGEAALTALVIALLPPPVAADHPVQGRGFALPILAAAVIALLLSPFASGWPDGLEWVAAEFNFLHEAAPTFVAPWPDYAIPGIGHEALATGLAGLVGVLAVFCAGILVSRLWCRPVSK